MFINNHYYAPIEEYAVKTFMNIPDAVASVMEAFREAGKWSPLHLSARNCYEGYEPFDGFDPRRIRKGELVHLMFMCDFDFLSPVRFLKFIRSLYEALGHMFGLTIVANNSNKTASNPFDLMHAIGPALENGHTKHFKEMLRFVEVAVRMDTDKLKTLEATVLRESLFDRIYQDISKITFYHGMSTKEILDDGAASLEREAETIPVSLPETLPNMNTLKNIIGVISQNRSYSIVSFPSVKRTLGDSLEDTRPLRRVRIVRNEGGPYAFFALVDIYRDDFGRLAYYVIAHVGDSAEDIIRDIWTLFGAKFAKKCRAFYLGRQ